MPKFNEQKLKKLKRIDALIRSIYLFPKTKKQINTVIKTDVEEIIVLAFLLIGDTVMYIPALRTLKRNFPNAKLTLVGGKLVETILQGQNLVDNFIVANCPWISPFDKSLKSIFSFFSSLTEINKKKYDLAIDFRGDWRNIFFMSLIRSTHKVSFDYSGGEYMLSDVITSPNRADHLIDEEFTLLEGMNCSYTEFDKLPSLQLNESDKKYLEGFKNEHHLINKSIIGIHPGASLEERKWDEAKYAELIIRLSKSPNKYKFLIFEGPKEKETVNKITGFFNDEQIDYLIINKGLKEYLTLINCCQILICNDSGAAHVGAAYDVPVVVIFGKGDPLEVRPFGRNQVKIVSHPLECKPCHLINCKYGTNLCMKMVTVDEVYAQVTSIYT
jgi:lipopolysaccharide heptosyltransferase II